MGRDEPIGKELRGDVSICLDRIGKDRMSALKAVRAGKRDFPTAARHLL